jgi:leucyl aminopeptidase (aminopeptidase T)
LIFASRDPDLLFGQNPDLISLYLKTNLIHAKPVMELRANNAMNWCIATAPVHGWIDKVYPDVDQEDRADSFWVEGI